MPKERYRLYHAEKAKGGMALTMTAGSAIVSRDSPAAFGNLQAYRDEIVPWLRELADACHEHDCKVMIQLTHLGRRTGWNKADWLPVLVGLAGARAGAPLLSEERRGLGHRAHRRRLCERRAAHAGGRPRRHRVRGLRPSDGRLLVAGHQPSRRRIWRLARQPAALHLAGDRRGARGGRRRTSSSASAWSPTRISTRACRRRRASRSRGGWRRRGKFDFLNIIRGSIETDAALTKVIPITGMRSSPHLDFAGEVRAATKFPVFHAARIADVATARHAIATGKLDMVGMTRAASRRSAYRHEGDGGPRAPRSGPASARPTASTASMRAARRSASTMRRPAARRRSRM